MPVFLVPTTSKRLLRRLTPFRPSVYDDAQLELIREHGNYRDAQ